MRFKVVVCKCFWLDKSKRIQLSSVGELLSRSTQCIRCEQNLHNVPNVNISTLNSFLNDHDTRGVCGQCR